MGLHMAELTKAATAFAVPALLVKNVAEVTLGAVSVAASPSLPLCRPSCGRPTRPSKPGRRHCPSPSLARNANRAGSTRIASVPSNGLRSRAGLAQA